MKEKQKYKLGRSYSAHDGCFHTAQSINYGEEDSKDGGFPQTLVCGSSSKISSRKLMKKIVKFLNKDMKENKIKIPKKLLKKAGIYDAKQSDLVFEITMLGDRYPEDITGSKYPYGVVIYREEV